jgi:hypothetical protein
MRKILPSRLEAARITTGPSASDPSWGAYGKFVLHGPCGETLCIIASGADDGDPVSNGWEHVSVSTQRRCPNWIEMCFVKNLFWSDDECVVQFHPPKSEYVNLHQNCLHLWRHKYVEFPRPPTLLIGPVCSAPLSAAEASRACRELLKKSGL